MRMIHQAQPKVDEPTGADQEGESESISIHHIECQAPCLLM